MSRARGELSARTKKYRALVSLYNYLIKAASACSLSSSAEGSKDQQQCDRGGAQAEGNPNLPAPSFVPRGCFGLGAGGVIRGTTRGLSRGAVAPIKCLVDAPRVPAEREG